jgi:hypothetical protein
VPETETLPFHPDLQSPVRNEGQVESMIEDAAQIGKMFVTNLSFQWHEATTSWDGDKQVKVPAHWEVGATLSDKPSRYGSNQTMNFKVEQGIGQKLATILIPVVMADASQKADQLAKDSKAMFEALGNQTLKCLANPTAE